MNKSYTEVRESRGMKILVHKDDVDGQNINDNDCIKHDICKSCESYHLRISGDKSWLCFRGQEIKQTFTKIKDESGNVIRTCAKDLEDFDATEVMFQGKRIPHDCNRAMEHMLFTQEGFEELND